MTARASEVGSGIWRGPTEVQAVRPSLGAAPPARADHASANKLVRRRMAPYGIEVLDALAHGRVVSVRLFGNAPDPWAGAKVRRHTLGAGSVLVLPLGTDPDSLRWPSIPSLTANITGLPGDVVRSLAHALVRDGVRLAYLIDGVRSERSLRVVCEEAE